MTLEQSKGKINRGEHWCMNAEKGRYALHHKIDIIKQLAVLIDEVALQT